MGTGERQVSVGSGMADCCCGMDCSVDVGEGVGGRCGERRAGHPIARATWVPGRVGDTWEASPSRAGVFERTGQGGDPPRSIERQRAGAKGPLPAAASPCTAAAAGAGEV